MPSQPASSLQRATSATLCRYSPRGTSLDWGQVEKTCTRPASYRSIGPTIEAQAGFPRTMPPSAFQTIGVGIIRGMRIALLCEESAGARILEALAKGTDELAAVLTSPGSPAWRLAARLGLSP